jgi:hypothetical protein
MKSILSIKVFNTVGNVVYFKNDISSNSIDIILSGTPAGLYNLQVKTRKKTCNIKFVKN